MIRYVIALWIPVAAVLAGAQDVSLQGMLQDADFGRPRTWAVGESNGSVHCLGNGRMCVYEQGPDILQIVGPPYSATTIGRVTIEGTGSSCESRRIHGAALWEHRVSRDGAPIATMTDFVDSETPCFVRVVECAVPLELVFHPEPDVRLASNTQLIDTPANGALLVETPIGKPSVPFGNYPIPFAFFHQFACFGAATIAPPDESGAVHLSFGKGRGVLLVTGGPGLDECMRHMETAATTDVDIMLRRTRASWDAFTAEGRDFAAELPADVPMRERLVQVLDDVAVMIKAQQAAEGGVLAGYPYHLGYVRDQYGTHRGLVALGHEEMSRDILAFYYNVFSAFGHISNAQAFGIPGLFHTHENDDVEITGYITLQAFDYLARTGDAAFVEHIFPMLDWAWKAQQRHLVDGMLPFNGDETYVAGGILPRSALNDGSAEATMLFIDSGTQALAFAEKHTLWDADRVQQAHQCLDGVRQSYRENFWRDGTLITNNPSRRADPATLPRVRHGVCESCVTVHWTLRTPEGRYACLNCLNKPPLPAVPPETYVLQSVSLTPIYFHSGLFDIEDFRPAVEAILSAYEQAGTLPSRLGSDVAVGYDYGLLLYALTELDDPRARDFFATTLQLADDTGAWAEYYRGRKPSNTRCRPWESAINVEALLHWIDTVYANKP